MRSINVSNHKFGLVYPGMGTVVFRDASDLPEELVFHINYLGGDMPNYSLNFSPPPTSVSCSTSPSCASGRRGYEQISPHRSPTRRRSRPSSPRSTASS